MSLNLWNNTNSISAKNPNETVNELRSNPTQTHATKTTDDQNNYNN